MRRPDFTAKWDEGREMLEVSPPESAGARPHACVAPSRLLKETAPR